MIRHVLLHCRAWPAALRPNFPTALT